MLYQLSYASPSHNRNTNSGNPETVPQSRTDTLPLRAYHGTKIKVSTPPPPEQTTKRP